MNFNLKRYKGICAFQDRCRYSAKDCKFIHLCTEVHLQNALRSMVEDIDCLINGSKQELNLEINSMNKDKQKQAASVLDEGNLCFESQPSVAEIMENISFVEDETEETADEPNLPIS